MKNIIRINLDVNERNESNIGIPLPQKVIRSKDTAVIIEMRIIGYDVNDGYTFTLLSEYTKSKSHTLYELGDRLKIEGNVVTFVPPAELISTLEIVTNTLYIEKSGVSLDFSKFHYLAQLSDVDNTVGSVKEVYDDNYQALIDELEFKYMLIEDLTAEYVAAQVAEARVGADGTIYRFLKERLDVEYQKVTAQVGEVSNQLELTNNEIIDARGGKPTLRVRLNEIDRVDETGKHWTLIDGEWEERVGQSQLISVHGEVAWAMAEAEQAREDAVKAYEDAVAEAKRSADIEDALIRTNIQQGLSAVETELATAKQEAKDAANQALTDAKTHADAEVQASKEHFDGLIAEVESEVADAQATADSAVEQIDTAITNAGFTSLDETISSVQSISNQAQINASTAIDDAQDAMSSANTAITTANQAKEDAQTAITEAGEAVDSANTAKTNAQTALEDAQTALATAENADTKSGLAEAAANTAKNNAQTALDNSSTAKTNAQTALDNSSTAVADAEDAIIKAGQAETVANTAKTNAQTAIDDAQSALTTAGSADSKAGQAIEKANAIPTTITDIITDKNLVNGSYVDTKVDDATGAWSQELVRVEGVIDGIEIGGRNLLPSFRNDRWATSGYVEHISDYIFKPVDSSNASLRIDLNLEKGKEYTLTFNTDYMRVYFYSYDENNNRTYLVSGRSDRHHIVRISEDSSRQEIYINTQSGNIGLSRSTWDIKLEKGNKATDWTPAPEDLYSQEEFKIFNAQYTQDVTGITGRLTTVENTKLDDTTFQTFKQAEYQVTADKVVSTITRVDTAEGLITTQGTTITQQAGLIENKAEKTVVDSLSETVSSQGTSITQNATDIASKASSSSVDSLAGRVETAETSITQNATDIESKASQTEVDTVKGTVSTHTTTIGQHATAIASKADKTVVDTLSGTVSDQGTLITQNATDIKSKADTSLVNTIKGTVDTHTTEISQNATAIESKASSASVSTLTGRVSTAETTITQHATSIASKASQEEVDTVKGTVSGHTTTLSQHATAISSKAESELVNTIKGTVDTHSTEISQNATDITSKASSSSVNTLTGRVDTHDTDISQNATDIASKASSASVNTLTGIVDTHTTEISQNATDIASKANTATVNALTGRVNTAESNISQNATAITQRVTTTTYNAGIANKENTVLKQTTAPTHVNGRLWLDTSVTPNILKRSNGTTWIKATPTTPGEVGAYSQASGAGLAGRLTTAETNITQTATAITSKADKSTVDTLAGTVSTQGTSITQQADLIASKASQTEVDTVKGTVSGHTTTLSQHATQIASKAESSLVNTIKGTVDTHTTEISQNATDIASKASSSSVNALTGRVSTAETGISQNATDIKLKANTTTVNALTGRVNTAESSISTNAGAIKLKANQSTVDTLAGTVASLGSEFDVVAGQVSSRVWNTDIETAIDGIEVGGRNLVKGTSDEFELVEFYGWNYYVEINLPVKGDTHYTLSSRVIKVSGNQGLLIFEYDEQNVLTENYEINQWWDATGHYDMKRSLTIKTKPDTVKVNVGFRNNQQSYNTFRYREFQLEQGTIASNWQPALEDTDAKIDHIETEWTQTFDTFSQTVSSIDGRVTTQKQTIDSISSTVSGHGGRLSAVEQTASGLQTTVASKASQTQVTQLANGLSSTVSNLDWESRISGAERLEPDPRFNNWATIPFNRYDNNNTGSITISAEHLSTYNTPPPPSGGTRALRIRHSGSNTYPGWGGVVNQKQSRANQRVIIEFYALIPSGRHLDFTSNALGSGANSDWITSNEGTGKWERYAYFHEMGHSGTLSSYGYLVLAGGSTPSSSNLAVWWIDSYQVYDLGKSDMSAISQLSNSINLRVTKEGLLSQINIAAEQTLIQSNKLVLASRSVVFTGDAFIPSAQIVSLHADKINAGTINSARIDAKTIVTNGLAANVVSSNHILANELLVDKVFSNQASVDRLWAKAIWTNKITAMEIDAGKITSGTINAARLNVTDLRSKILTANVIDATQINGSTALFDKLFSTTASTTRLVAQGAWITNANIISLNADKINAGTINANRIATGTLDLNKLTVGARSTIVNNPNMLRDTSRNNQYAKWTGYDYSLLYQGSMGGLGLSANGGTLSFRAFIGRTTYNVDAFMQVTVRNSNGTIAYNQFRGTQVKAGATGWVSVTAQITKNQMDNGTHFLVSFRNFTTGLNNDVTYNNAKLENGDLHTAWSPHPDDAATKTQLGRTGVVEIHGGNIKADTLDVGAITGDLGEFINLSLKAQNSQASLSGSSFKIASIANSQSYIEMSNVPEIRARSANSAMAVMGQGQTNYSVDNAERFFIGTKISGSQHGIMIRKNQGWAIMREADSFGGTPAKYYTVKYGQQRVAVVETLMADSTVTEVPTGNATQFIINSNYLARLNGFSTSTSSTIAAPWPNLTTGDLIKYAEGTPGNESGIQSIFKIWTSNNTSVSAFDAHVTFNTGYSGASDRRIKHNIKDTYVEALSHINSLKFKEFKYNSDNRYEPLGIIAQDSGILRVKWEEMESIDIQRSIMLGLKGVQELHTIVKEQAEEIKQLKEIINQ